MLLQALKYHVAGQAKAQGEGAYFKQLPLESKYSGAASPISFWTKLEVEAAFLSALQSLLSAFIFTFATFLTIVVGG